MVSNPLCVSGYEASTRGRMSGSPVADFIASAGIEACSPYIIRTARLGTGQAGA